MFVSEVFTVALASAENSNMVGLVTTHALLGKIEGNSNADRCMADTYYFFG